MNIGWRDLGVVQELFENGRKRKSEPRVELLLTKENGVVRNLPSRCWISFHQLNRDVTGNEEAFAEFQLIEKLSSLPRTRVFGTHSCPAALPTLPSHIG